MRDADDFTVGGGEISGVPAGTDRKRGVVKGFDVFSQSGNMPLVRSAAAAENADSAREHLSTDLGKFSDSIGTGIFVRGRSGIRLGNQGNAKRDGKGKKRAEMT